MPIARWTGPLPIRRLAVVSAHTSPLAQPGTGDGGGLNVYVLQTSRRLAALGVEVDVFTRLTDAALPPQVEVAPGLTVHHVPAGPPRALPKEQLHDVLGAFLLAVRGLAGGTGHDVIHAHYWLSGWVGRHLREAWGVPLVQSFHTLGRVKNAALAPGETPEAAGRLAEEERILAVADRVVVPTCDEARILHRAFGTSGARISVVPLGVDLEVFRPGPRVAVPEAPAGEGPLLLFVGRLQPLKGPDIAVRTLAEIRRVVPGARLLIVGGISGNGTGRTGPDELLRLAAEVGVADAVAFAPARPQEELAQLYRAADLVLVPSRSESFGLVALEAQASGTPVVAADVGGLTTVVRGGGTLVAGHDPIDHAAAAVRYLVDPEEAARAGSAGHQAAAGATWTRTVERLLAVYAGVTRDARAAVPARRGA